MSMLKVATFGDTGGEREHTLFLNLFMTYFNRERYEENPKDVPDVVANRFLILDEDKEINEHTTDSLSKFKDTLLSGTNLWDVGHSLTINQSLQNVDCEFRELLKPEVDDYRLRVLDFSIGQLKNNPHAMKNCQVEGDVNAIILCFNAQKYDVSWRYVKIKHRLDRLMPPSYQDNVVFLIANSSISQTALEAQLQAITGKNELPKNLFCFQDLTKLEAGEQRDTLFQENLKQFYNMLGAIHRLEPIGDDKKTEAAREQKYFPKPRVFFKSKIFPLSLDSGLAHTSKPQFLRSQFLLSDFGSPSEHSDPSTSTQPSLATESPITDSNNSLPTPTSAFGSSYENAVSSEGVTSSPSLPTPTNFKYGYAVRYNVRYMDDDNAAVGIEISPPSPDSLGQRCGDRMRRFWHWVIQCWEICNYRTLDFERRNPAARVVFVITFVITLAVSIVYIVRLIRGK